MRISDWSSDVCSSDLGPRTLQHRMQRSVRRRARTIVRIGRMPVKPIATSDMRRQRKTARNVRQAARMLAPRGKIGRAHVWTPVTNAHLVCRLLLEKKKHGKKQIKDYDKLQNKTSKIKNTRQNN